MKNRNEGEQQASLPVKSANENASANATKISNFNGSSKEQAATGTERTAKVNNDEDDRNRRSDFRYFYSGRKLL